MSAGGEGNATCPECQGTGNEYEDSMLAVGIPGGWYPTGPCSTCHGTGQVSEGLRQAIVGAFNDDYAAEC